MPEYIFSYNKPNLHYVDIQFRLPNPGKKVVLKIPSWRPGRYQSSHFARNIQKWAAYNEKAALIPFTKISKDTWVVETNGCKELIVNYNYFAHQMDAGSSFLDEDQLYINPVNCCIYNEERMGEPCRIKLDLPPNYHVATSLKLVSKYTYEAADYQELADSPFIASLDLRHDVLKIKGVRFHFWFIGEVYPDYSRLEKDFASFIKEQITMMGDFPVSDFHFLFQIPSYPVYHGVEHLASTVITFGPGYSMVNEKKYRTFLSVSSHELFHVWNVKTIRPAEWLPYRFNEESYSRLGYVAEGFTTYYGDLFLLRSGVFKIGDYLEIFEKHLNRHVHNFGRFNISVAESSFDTWLDGYQPGAPYRKTSIYIQGALIAFLLDYSLRKDSGNKLSLDDVMTYLYKEFGKTGKGLTEEGLLKGLKQLSGKDYRSFFEKNIWGRPMLEEDISEALKYYGLDLHVVNSESEAENKFGIKLDEKSVIEQIFPNSPADKAGLSINDEIIAINGLKIDNNINDLILYHSEETIQITIFRNGHLANKHIHSDGKNYFGLFKIRKPGKLKEDRIKNFEAWTSVSYNFPE